MQEVYGNIWDFYDPGNWIVITTNGFVKKNNECVMGRGIAKQAKDRFPELSLLLGRKIEKGGNRVHVFEDIKIITFPVKHVWWEKADINLIKESAKQLQRLSIYDKIYLVRPGCGNGQLKWDLVKPVIEKILDDRFIIVEIGK